MLEPTARADLNGSPNAEVKFLDQGLQAQLNRHDHHNLELKSSLKLNPLQTAGELQLHFFLPLTFQTHACSKDEIRTDFHSRMRLSIPRDTGLEPESLKNEINELRRLLDGDIISENQKLFNHAKHIGAVMGEYIKAHKSRQRRELTLLFSIQHPTVLPDESLVRLGREIETLMKVLSDLRLVITSDKARSAPIVKLLGKYVNQVFLDYLGSIKNQMDLITQKQAGANRTAGWLSLEKCLDQVREKEFKRVAEKNNPSQMIEDEMEREMMVLKLSQMKKFFQSEMFVEVNQLEAIKRLNEPIAAGAAAFAALWAAVFESFSNPRLSGFGFKGIFVICLSIALYALKDRLKDRFRSVFIKKIGGYLPDVERDLKAQGSKFGNIKEWLCIKNSQSVDEEILSLRHAAGMTEAEKYLPEDVVHYKRLFDVSFPIKTEQSRWALRDVTRINVQRFLKHMDDAFKSVRLLDAEGQFTNVKSHRVYHFYVCVSSKLGAQTKRELYRVVMDKNGIDRVESI